jgi:hypothetical protein
MDYLELMRGAGLGDVLIPKKEFVKEHERLVKLLNQSDLPALRKEAKEQKAELKKEGGSGKSNYIARLMAEAKYKHRDPSEKDKPYDETTTGKYRKPVMDPERDETKMSRADKFDYRKIANKSQSGTNKEAYGASPFITHHFGLAQSARKPRETAAQTAARRKFSGREEQSEEERVSASEKRKARRDKQTAPRVPKSMAEIIRDKKEKAARTAESEPKGYMSSSPDAPLISRPAHITKQNWLNYLNSKGYRDLLEQRQFEIDSRRR